MADDDDPVNEVTRVGPVRMEIEECVICGKAHHHGAPDDLRAYFGADEKPHLTAMCRSEDVEEDAPDGYFLELAPVVTLSRTPWYEGGGQ